MKRCAAGLAASLALSMCVDAHAQTATDAGATPPAATAQSQEKKTQPTKPAKKPVKPKPKKNAPQKDAAPKKNEATAATQGAAQSKATPDAAAAAPSTTAAPIAAPSKTEATAATQSAAQPKPAPDAAATPSTNEKAPTLVAPAPAADTQIDAPGRARLVVPVADVAPRTVDTADPETVPVIKPTLSTAAAAPDPPPAPSSGNSAASAKEKEEIEVLRQTTANLIKSLVESGILTQEKADALMREAKQSAAQSAAAQTSAESKVVRVPYVPQFMRDQMTEEVRQQVVAQAKAERWALPNAVPEWVDRFTFFGDFRFRYQDNILSPNNAPAVDVNGTNLGDGLQLLNTTQNFDYFRYQLRLGTNVRVADTVLVGASLASGNTGNPVSLNQTLGTGLNKNTVVLDQAYLRFDPARWVTLWGGRFPSPFYSTDLVWYDQLNFDGMAATVRAPFSARSQGWLTLGAFPIANTDCTDAVQVNCGYNKWLYGGQGVFQTALRGGHSLTAGLAYYYWYKYQGQFNSPTVNPEDPTFVPRFAQKGNTYFNIVTSGGNPLLGLAPQYHELDLNASLDLGYWDPVRTVLTGDIVKNLGYNQQQIYQQTGGLVNQPARTLGWYVRLLVGKPLIEGWGDWQGWAGYKYVQRDSVVDGYNDPDFHFGGTDAQGYLIGLSVGIAKNTFARLRWLSANAIDGPPFAWDVLQLDVGARF